MPTVIEFLAETLFQVFMVRKLVGEDLNTLYAMKVLKKVCGDWNLFSRV